MTTRTRPTNDTALDAYITAQREARAALEALTRYLDTHQDATAPAQIHWGHVGDIRHVVDVLNTVNEPA
jgi:hypothetical protein